MFVSDKEQCSVKSFSPGRFLFFFFYLMGNIVFLWVCMVRLRLSEKVSESKEETEAVCSIFNLFKIVSTVKIAGISKEWTG